MELKSNCVASFTYVRERSNRTFMELKYLRKVASGQYWCSSNRTFMELKYGISVDYSDSKVF